MDLSLDGPKGPQEQRADFVVKQCTGNQMNFDESYCLRFWGDDDMTSLPPKGEGMLVMTVILSQYLDSSSIASQHKINS